MLSKLVILWLETSTLIYAITVLLYPFNLQLKKVELLCRENSLILFCVQNNEKKLHFLT